LNVNGYKIKDVEESLKHDINMLKKSVIKQNKYFESEGIPDFEQYKDLINTLEKKLSHLALLSSLHCYYNSTVSYNGFTIQQMVKLQAAYTTMKQTYDSMNQDSFTLHGYSGVKVKDDAKEFAVSQLSDEICENKSTEYVNKLRELKSSLRIANSQSIETTRYIELEEYFK
jgi:hypothetical protein